MPRYKKKSHLQYEKRDTKRTIRDTPNKRLKRICGITTPKKSVKRKRATVLTPLGSAKRRLQLLFSTVQKDNNLNNFERNEILEVEKLPSFTVCQPVSVTSIAKTKLYLPENEKTLFAILCYIIALSSQARSCA